MRESTSLRAATELTERHAAPAGRSERILVRWLFRHAIQHPDRPALQGSSSPDTTAGVLSWGELASDVLRIAGQFESLGIRAGQQVAVATANCPEAILTSLALQQLGAIEAAMGCGLHEPDLMARTIDFAATLLIVETEAIARRIRSASTDQRKWGSEVLSLQQVRQDIRQAHEAGPVSSHVLRKAYHATDQINPHDVALILWTSGTQARPRGAMLSHHALASNAAGKLDSVPQTIDDRRLTILPLYHAYARTCDLGTWLLSGGTLAAATGWQGLVDMSRQFRPTLVNMVPSLAVQLLQVVRSHDDPSAVLRQLGLDRLRVLGCGGAPLSAADFQAYRELGMTVVHGYGLTEAGPVVCSSRPESASPGMVGAPVRGVTIRIDSDQRLWVRGPGTMKGYWNAPEATAQKWEEGWLDTGDLARREADGQVTILGRADETLVLANGRKLQPFALEQACMRLPGIDHAILCLHDGTLTLLLATADLSAEQRPADLPSFDAQRCLEELEQVWASFPAWQRPQRLVWLPRPLRDDMDELTAKGTVRRGPVIQRWAGSCHS